MLTVKGYGSQMNVIPHPPTYHLANKEPPKLSPEELEQRKKLMSEVREFEKKENLKTCETDDRSAPLVSGKRSTDGGWSESAGGAMNPMAMGRAGLKSTRGGPPGARGGRGGRGGGALGDLFAGGFMPNPGALRGSSRGGRGGGR